MSKPILNEEFQRMQKLAGIQLNENYNVNLNNEALKIGYAISKDVRDLINNKINDDIDNALWDGKDADKIFGFYKNIFDAIMSRIYEDYGDTFNSRAGAASDEY